MSDIEDYEYLLEKENVTGVGFNDDGVLIVYVTKKIPESELPPDAIVSHNVEADRETDVRESDIPRLHPSNARRQRPINAGLSEGLRSQTMAGTGGPLARVTNPHSPYWSASVSEGQLVRVSNCHVYASSRAKSGMFGDSIVQPARLDSRSADDEPVGHLVGYVPLSGTLYTDCAARTVSEEDASGVHNLGEELPKSVRRNYSGLSGETVRKSGRTSGVTSATVETVNATVRVQIDDNRVETFRDQIIAGPLSRPGDSGSPVYDDSGSLLGLLFAGSDRITILNKISRVEEIFGVKMVTDRVPKPEPEPEPEPEPVEHTLVVSPESRIGTLEYSFDVKSGTEIDFTGNSATRVDDRINGWLGRWSQTFTIRGEVTETAFPPDTVLKLNDVRVTADELVEATAAE